MHSPHPTEHWAYRAKITDPLIEVEVIELDPSNKKSPRCVVEFLDGPAAGRREKVPAGRLKTPWADVDAFRQAEDDWARVESDDDTVEAEVRAAWDVFEAFFGDKQVDVGIRVATATIARPDAVEEILGCSINDVIDGAETAMIDGELVISPNGTMALARRLCEIDPRGVLEGVLAEEARAERRCMGEPARPGEDPTRPDIAWLIYREHTRPVHEVLRQWCGYRAVSAVEQALADEAEVRRLKELTHRLIRTLGYHDERRAELYLDELRTGAVTGPLVRPAPSAPRPAKVVTVEVSKRRYWA